MCALCLFWACSQSVSSSDGDSGSDTGLSSVPGYHQTEDREAAKDSSSSGSSASLDITRYIPDQKMDCKFSESDSVWRFETAEADTLINATIQFKNNGDLWGDLVMEARTQGEEECQQTAAIFMVIGSMAEASDETDMVMLASCEGTLLNMTMQGTADEKYTAQSKSEMFAEMCK